MIFKARDTKDTSGMKRMKMLFSVGRERKQSTWRGRGLVCKCKPHSGGSHRCTTGSAGKPPQRLSWRRNRWYRFTASPPSFSPCHVLQCHTWTSWFQFPPSAPSHWHHRLGQLWVAPLSCSTSLPFASHRSRVLGTKVWGQTQKQPAGPRSTHERLGRTYRSRRFHNQAVECYNKRQTTHHPRLTQLLSPVAGFRKWKGLRAIPSLQLWSKLEPCRGVGLRHSSHSCCLFAVLSLKSEVGTPSDCTP